MSDSSSSIPLSDADTHALYIYGRNTAQDAFGVIWETILISTHGVFFVVAVYSIFRKGLKSRGSIVMLCAIASLYASSLTLWVLGVTLWFKNTHSVFMTQSNIPLQGRSALANDNIASFYPQKTALYLFNMMVGDSVVIWRAWILYPRALWVLSIPCVMLLVSFSFGIVEVVCEFSSFIHQITLPDGGRICPNANVSWVFSLATNAACTILIGYKAWQHRRSIKSSGISVYPRRMSADKVLSILVESGLIYCFLWLTQIFNFVTFGAYERTNAKIYVYWLLEGIGNQISGMYPTLIIAIVNFKQSIWETTTEPVSTLQFAGQSKGRDTDINPSGDVESTGVVTVRLQASASRDV